MPTTAIRYGTSFDGNTGPGAGDWSDPTRIASRNSSWARLNPIGPGGRSKRLRSINFSALAADIPDGATINGLEVVVENTQESPDFTAQFLTVGFQKAGVDAGNNIASTGNQSVPGALSDRVFGGVSNLAGMTCSKSDLTNAGFAIYIETGNTSDEADCGVVFVDALGLRVTYTDPPPVVRAVKSPSIGDWLRRFRRSR